MDEKQGSSSWDDLINQLGAKPAPDALERRRPAIETKFDAPPPPPPAPKGKAGDWNALASELGIESREPAGAAQPPTRPQPSVGPGAMEASFASIEPLESQFKEIIEEEIADVEYGESELDEGLFEGDDSDFEDESDVEDESEIEEDDDVEAGVGDELPPSTLSGEAARHAFEALFRAGSFNAPPAGGRRAESPKPREESDDELFAGEARSARPARTPRPTAPAKPVRADDDRGRDRDEPAADEERPRRRRRRRGGRGRNSAVRDERGQPSATSEGSDIDVEDDVWGEAPGDAEAAGPVRRDEPAAEGEQEDRPRRRRRSRRGRGRGAASADGSEAPPEVGGGRRRHAAEPVDDDDADAEEEDLAEAGGELDDDESSVARSSHKSIPSWSDAIGVMVDVNMQSRKNAPQRPGSPRGGRGRGRGGRGGRGGGRRSS